MLLIIGLGNPGEKYSQTRHNAGFLVLEELAKKLGVARKRLGLFGRKNPWTREMASLVREGTLAGQKVILAKPQTFMNLSGLAAAGLLKKHRLTTADLLVISDDLDLPLGTLRLKQSGQSGGHKGLESIINQLGRDDFLRLRLGIGPCPPRQEPADFVLEPLSSQDQEHFQQISRRAVEAVVTYLTQGLPAAMNKFNCSFLGDTV